MGHVSSNGTNLLILVKTVFLDLHAQGLPVDAEDACGAALPPFGPPKHEADILLFQLL